tara:strand:- start:855 stop:1271 length:417 start_codon:yes stop_codon:yes gene_type:complete
LEDTLVVDQNQSRNLLTGTVMATVMVMATEETVTEAAVTEEVTAAETVEVEMADDFFDFGFTAVDENELEAVQKAAAQTETVAAEKMNTQEKIDKLYNAIVPLLNNLKKNPEKEYILWPDRLNKVEQFETHLQKIYNS